MISFADSSSATPSVPRVDLFPENSGVTVGFSGKSTVLVGGSIPMSFGVTLFFADDSIRWFWAGDNLEEYEDEIGVE